MKRLSASRVSLIPITPGDISRIAQILEKYQDSCLDFVDASVMAVAGGLKIVTILTLERRDFSLFRPRHCDTFKLLP